jgi:hypothetical protein
MGYVGVKRSVASKIGASTNSFNSSSSVKDSKGLIKVEGKKKKNRDNTACKAVNYEK